MSAKHTPGPWRLTQETTQGEFVTAQKIRNKHDHVIAVMHCNATANAALICAAPDLLNMLERMLYEAREGGTCHCTMEQAEKAIAKAKGAI